ncbi:MAG: MarR family transcriptional regulator [Eubacteriales bacterium]|nr:MarR family transcriptional regulator [Eubacteriales bacterium]
MENRRDQMARELRRYYTLWRESNTMYEEWAKEQGLSLSTLLIVYALWEEEGCTQKQISRNWLIPKQTVSAALKEFEEKGYLELTPAASDKRNKQILLTDSGREFAGRIMTKLHARELYVMEQMGLDKMTEMNDALARFRDLFREGGAGGNE